MKAWKIWLTRASLLCTAVLLTGSTFALTGCNTTEGVGKDIKAAGGALEDAADDAKD